jgi:hypothetical protein
MRERGRKKFPKNAFEYRRVPGCLSRMKKNLLSWTTGLAAAASLAFSSCAYDPYYSSAGGSYSSGYGDGYGYGGGNFSTSLFVSTGDPRWGYDPYSYCYYDYRSRRYYDPYLYGYYPIGYRPYSVYGVPHPHGWRQGSGYCPPPRTVRNVMVGNYRNRESAYRNTNYSWANQVRQRPDSGRRVESQGTNRGTYSRPGSSSSRPSGRDSYQRPESGSRRSREFGRPNRAISQPRESSRNDPRPQYRQDSRRSEQQSHSSSSSRRQNSSRPPAGYNTPVVRPETREAGSIPGNSLGSERTRQPEFTPRRSRSEERTRQAPAVRERGTAPQPDSQPRRSEPNGSGESRPSRGEGRGLRSLGDG